MRLHPGNKNYYLEYKALFTDEEWKIEWGKLLDEYKDKLRAINLWLSIEGRYDLIMDNAEPDGDTIIDYYGDELFKLYPERCMKVLANAADKQAQISQNRRDYRRVAKALRNISSHPGGKELASQLAEKYRKWFPRRRAMLDELSEF